MIILDASVAAKLVIEEAGSVVAKTWFAAHRGEFGAPDLIAIEVAQAIVRRVNARAVAPGRGRAALNAWQKLLNGGIALFRSSPDAVSEAAGLAISLGHPVKDCLYLVLAIEQGGTLVTADARFHARAAPRFPMIELFTA